MSTDKKPFDPSVLPAVPLLTEEKEFTAKNGDTFTKQFTYSLPMGTIDNMNVSAKAQEFIKRYVKQSGDTEPKAQILDGTTPITIGENLCKSIANLMYGEELGNSPYAWNFMQWFYFIRRDPITANEVIIFFNELGDKANPQPDEENPVPNDLEAGAEN